MFLEVFERVLGLVLVDEPEFRVSLKIYLSSSKFIIFVFDPTLITMMLLLAGDIKYVSKND